MKFTEQLWAASLPIYNKIIEHPFNKELSLGTLPDEKFKFYIHQDSLYLADFSKALALLSAKAHDGQQQLAFMDFARNAIIVERILHEQYIKDFNINHSQEKAKGCFTYTHFLLSTCALHTFEEGIAAVLPCFWIYKKIGDFICKNQLKPNPYQDWIDTYSGVEFTNSVNNILAICDEVASHASINVRNNMTEKYLTSCRMEYMFWDSAYQLEQWPV